MIDAVVLSGGESSRMGRPKALLPIEGGTFIERIVGALAQSDIRRICVVLGHDAETIRSAIAHLPVEIVVNPLYKTGQLSSLQAGVRRFSPDPECSGLLVHLVDHPYITTSLVDRLLRAFEESKSLIAVPCFKGKRGHPVIFGRALFDELLSAPLDQGAKAVVNAHRGATIELETDEEGITFDIDTPELYRRLVKGD